MNISPIKINSVSRESFGRIFSCQRSEKMGYEYPKGHPCEKCPYQFDVEVPSCMMGANPMTCVWRFYKKLLGGEENIVIEPRNTSNQRKKKLEDCMEVLIQVGEEKYGKSYGNYLRRNYCEK